MQVVTISSPAAISFPLALHERKVGGKEEHFLLSRAYSRLQHRAHYNFLLSPTVAASRSHPFYARTPFVTGIFYYMSWRYKKKVRVPILSSGSGLADETVESIIGILGLRRWSANCITWYGLDMLWLDTPDTLDARESCENTLGTRINSDAGGVASVSCALLSGVRIMFVQESLHR